MDRIWTLDDRQRQAEMIKNWRPWERSTGPKTEEGKEACKMNACKSGAYSRKIKVLRELLKKQAGIL